MIENIAYAVLAIFSILFLIGAYQAIKQNKKP